MLYMINKKAFCCIGFPNPVCHCLAANALTNDKHQYSAVRGMQAVVEDQMTCVNVYLDFSGVQRQQRPLLAAGHDVVGRRALHRLRLTHLFICNKQRANTYKPNSDI